MKLVKEIQVKDRRVIISVSKEEKKLRIFGYGDSKHHIVIYLKDLEELLKVVKEEVKTLENML